VPFAILDTNVYIDHWERGSRSDELQLVRQSLIIRHSAVVLSELRRGARSTAAKRLVESLRRAASVILTPTEEDWWRAGEIISRLGMRRGWDPNKRRELQNDALIALTARRQGAIVVTGNAVDFQLLGEELGVEVWVLRGE
jgi:predicted nucleic acid-binding protein